MLSFYFFASGRPPSAYSEHAVVEKVFSVYIVHRVIYVSIKSTGDEITGEQIELITKRIKNPKYFIHITEQASLAQKKRLKMGT